MGRTIRTCSALALVAALAAAARVEARVAPSPLADYARARIASDDVQAARSFAAALTAAPDSATVAYRAYREGVIAGDYELTLRAAQTLERLGAVPPEACLLFYVAAVRQRDWREAARRLNAIGHEPSLAFVAAQLGEWLALATRAPVDLSAAKAVGGANAYALESATLLKLARGETQAGVDSVRTLWTIDPYRAQSLRIAAAATLAARGARDQAIALLVADTESTRAARLRIAARKKLDVAVDSPARGAAFVMARMAGDLTVEGGGLAAITLARFAQFADPKNARIALLVAGALMADKRYGPALALVDTLTGDPLYGDDAASLRIELLEALDRRSEALAAAAPRAVRSVNDATRLGDIEMRAANFAAAAKRYDAAIERAGTETPWAMLHASGNAHLLAGEWEAARARLEQALVVAPNEAVVLNALGFGLVDHGVDVGRGRALIERAVSIRPDNAAIADSLGWAAYRLGDIGQAIVILERAQRLDPVEPEIGEHLGDAYWASGRRIEARYAWAAAREAAGDAIRVRLAMKIDRGLP